jgi:hypothetical protein
MQREELERRELLRNTMLQDDVIPRNMGKTYPPEDVIVILAYKIGQVCAIAQFDHYDYLNVKDSIPEDDAQWIKDQVLKQFPTMTKEEVDSKFEAIRKKTTEMFLHSFDQETQRLRNTLALKAV